MAKKYRGNKHRVAAHTINKYRTGSLYGHRPDDLPEWPKDGFEASRLIIAMIMGALILCVFPLLIISYGKEGTIGSAFSNLFSFRSNYSYSLFTQSKRDTMWFITSLCLPLAALYVGLRGWKTIRWQDPARILGVLFFAWMTVTVYKGSYITATNANGELVVWCGSGRFEGMTTQYFYFALMLLFSLVKPSRRTNAVLAALAMLVFFFVTIGQYNGENPLGMYPNGRSIYTNYEFQSLTGNIDMGGGYLTLIAALLLAVFVVQGGVTGYISLIPGLMGVLVILMTGVESGKIGVYAGGILLLMAMMLKPELRCRGFVLLGLLAAVLTLRQLIGLPWVDGLEAPWNLPQRTDAILPKLSGGQPVIFPWNVTVKKLIPLGGTVVCIGLAFLVSKYPGPAFRAWVPWALLVLGAAGYVAYLYFADIPWTEGTAWELHEILHGRPQDVFGSERWGVWTHSIHIARENLLFGTGPDTFMAAMDAHLKAEGTRLKQHFDTPHNLFVAVLVQNGLPGLLLYVGTMATAVIRGMRNKKTWPLLAAVVCYLVQGMFTFSMVIVSPMFWACLGMLIAAYEPGKKKKKPISADDTFPPKPRRSNILTVTDEAVSDEAQDGSVDTGMLQASSVEELTTAVKVRLKKS